MREEGGGEYPESLRKRTLGQTSSSLPRFPSSLATNSPDEEGYHFGLAGCRSRDKETGERTEGSWSCSIGVDRRQGAQGPHSHLIRAGCMKNKLAFQLKNVVQLRTNSVLECCFLLLSLSVCRTNNQIQSSLSHSPVKLQPWDK